MMMVRNGKKEDAVDDTTRERERKYRTRKGGVVRA
jgi:hypothetical protein